jgi:hypothetical protein
MLKPFFIVLVFLTLLTASACSVLAPQQGPAAPSTSTQTPAALPQITPTTSGQIPDSGTVSDEQFDLQLAQALQTRSFDQLRASMGSSFAMAGWRSEGRDLTPDAAMDEIRATLLAGGSAPVPVFDADLPALLDGTDPLNLFGPGSNAVRALLVRGLGSTATDEAILILSRDPATGKRYWHGLLFAPGGFQPQTGGQEELDQQLAQALANLDFTALRTHMQNRFSFAYWNAGLYEYTSEESLQRLQESLLAPGAAPQVQWTTDIPALLKGADPLSFWGPVATPVRAVHITGLGSSAKEEAVLVIGRDPSSGQLYWHGILVPQAGSFQSSVMETIEVAETSVQYALAKDDLNIRIGPGTTYAVVGTLFEGQTAQVTGKSMDGAWWRIYCTQDPSGLCWISSDPALSEPATAP